MRRILGAISFLLILVVAGGGCQDRRKDQIPTQVEKLPKGQPQPVPNSSPD